MSSFNMVAAVGPRLVSTAAMNSLRFTKGHRSTVLASHSRLHISLFFSDPSKSFANVCIGGGNVGFSCKESAARLFAIRAPVHRPLVHG